MGLFCHLNVPLCHLNASLLPPLSDNTRCKWVSFATWMRCKLVSFATWMRCSLKSVRCSLKKLFHKFQHAGCKTPGFITQLGQPAIQGLSPAYFLWFLLFGCESPGACTNGWWASNAGKTKSNLRRLAVLYSLMCLKKKSQNRVCWRTPGVLWLITIILRAIL